MYEHILNELKRKENSGFIPGDLCESIRSLSVNEKSLHGLESISKAHPSDVTLREYLKEVREHQKELRDVTMDASDDLMLEVLVLIVSQREDFEDFSINKEEFFSLPEVLLLKELIYNDKMNSEIDMLTLRNIDREKKSEEMIRVARQTRNNICANDYITIAKNYTYIGMLSVFERSKQVFSVDETVAEALFNMKEVIIDPEKLVKSSLPTVFAIDLSRYKTCAYDTAFVTLMPVSDPKDNTLAMIKVVSALIPKEGNECVMATETHTVEYDEDGRALPLDIQKKDIDFNDQMECVAPTLQEKDILFFTDAFLSYVCSKEPDVKESDFSKQHHKQLSASSRVKNKPTEIKHMEVGYKVGSTIRLNIKNQEEALKTKIEKEGWTLAYKRKSPTPHMRCAHYQTYHTGPGRIYTEVKWIEPTLVGFCVGEKEFLVPDNLTVHNVKETAYANLDSNESEIDIER